MNREPAGVGSITNSYTTGNVHAGASRDADSYVGGLVGTNKATISDSYSTGAVSGAVSCLGGSLGNEENAKQRSPIPTGTPRPAE